jgi:hypothetical protein
MRESPARGESSVGISVWRVQLGRLFFNCELKSVVYSSVEFKVGCKCMREFNSLKIYEGR